MPDGTQDRGDTPPQLGDDVPDRPEELGRGVGGSAQDGGDPRPSSARSRPNGADRPGDLVRDGLEHDHEAAPELGHEVADRPQHVRERMPDGTQDRGDTPPQLRDDVQDRAHAGSQTPCHGNGGIRQGSHRPAEPVHHRPCQPTERQEAGDERHHQPDQRATLRSRAPHRPLILRQHRRAPRPSQARRPAPVPRPAGAPGVAPARPRRPRRSLIPAPPVPAPRRPPARGRLP